MSKLKITLLKSVIGCTEAQVQNIKGLGLRRIRHSVIRDNRPSVRGQVKQILHLVQVEELDG